MRQSSQCPLAAAVGAALALGAQAPAIADLIEYSFEGTVSYGGGAGSGYLGESYSATARVDTTADSILSFAFTVSNVGTWSGSGGTIYNTASRFALGVSTGEGATYDMISDGFTPLYSSPINSFIGSPGDFGGFVDGYPTTFNLIGMSTNEAYISLGPGAFEVSPLTAAGGSQVTVPAPATAGLALAGLAALGAVRRRKAAKRR